MPRVAFLAAAAASAALVASACGGADTAPAPEAPRAQAPIALETTDGRLGGATDARPGDAPRELSRGGVLDVRERDDAPRRDGVGAGAACPNPGLAPSAASLPAIAAATLCLLNGERADRGLAPLAANDQLTAAAAAYAQDLVAGSYFSHTGRDGSDVLDRIERTGYIREDRSWRVGENLAWGTGALATPGSIMRAWMNSPGHRENILNPAYREVGVGVVVGNPAATNGAGATYATAFGVVEGAEQPAATPTKKKARKARRGKRRRGSRKARAARRTPATSRRGKSGKLGKARRLKGRGPIARIAI